MMIKFFARGQGSGSGPVEYCIRADIEGREHCPPVVLAGDASMTRDLIDSIDRQWRYTSGVVSFELGDKPSEDQQQEVMAEFESLGFSGLERQQYDILWVRHQHTEGGRVELHFVTPRLELSTGKALNIAPPGHEKTYNVLRDYLNEKHGWASPDDPERSRLVQTVERDAAETTEHSNRLLDREAINEFVVSGIEDGLIFDRSSLVEALEGAGLEITRQSRDTVTAKDPETGERFRMRGAVYEQGWTREAQFERSSEPDSDGSERADQETRNERTGKDARTLEDRKRELESIHNNRAKHHKERYPRPVEADPELLGDGLAWGVGAAADSGVVDGRFDDLERERSSEIRSEVIEPSAEHSDSPFDAPDFGGKDFWRDYFQPRRQELPRNPEQNRSQEPLEVRHKPVLRAPQQVNAKDDGHDGVDTIRARVIELRERLAEWFRARRGELQNFIETSRGATERRYAEMADRNRNASERIRAETEATGRRNQSFATVSDQDHKALTEQFDRERRGYEQLAREGRKLDQSTEQINTHKTAIEAHREAEALKAKGEQEAKEKAAHEANRKQSERDYGGFEM